MGACLSCDNDESYEEDFSSESSDEETLTPPVKQQLPGVANITWVRPMLVPKVIWTPPRPMVVARAVKASGFHVQHPCVPCKEVPKQDDSLALTALSSKDMVPSGEAEIQELPDSELPRLGLRGTLNLATNTAETVAMEEGVETNHRRGHSSAEVEGGMSVAAPPGGNRKIKDDWEAREDEAYSAYLDALLDEGIGHVWFPESQASEDDLSRRRGRAAAVKKRFEHHVWTGQRALSEYCAIKAGGPRGHGIVVLDKPPSAARGSRRS